MKEQHDYDKHRKRFTFVFFWLYIPMAIITLLLWVLKIVVMILCHEGK